jgi:2-phospho-L-lactate/phosphoenolpyruvate guanylyltransferase
VLGPWDRAALCRQLLGHVLAVARDVTPDAAVHVVSACPEVRGFATERGARVLAEREPGHVPALTAAMQALPIDQPVLILSADLPMLAAADLHAMVQEPADVVIATDREGQGTNALLLKRPGLIPLRFGPGSCAAHVGEAERAGYRVSIVRRPGLANDVDLPEHLQIFSVGA